ncbi:MAG: SDR family NAD(P)-dependent oxidoreductase [Bacteroidales bacterium]|nr:SDR family NAD(P)-dependent oxidoreductase [Bacteroidales bacterium]
MRENKKAILITGAFGGLGTALVEMARNLPGINYIIATDVQAEIEEFYKADKNVVGLVMDVASEISIKNVYIHLQEKKISVKYLINCAGVSIFHPVSESTEVLLDKTLKVNTYGPILTVSVFLDDLIKNRGRVVQISSDSVRLSTLFQPYPNSKIALEAFSTSMQQELGLFGVDLILIRPGAINTNLVAEMKSISSPITNSKYEKYFQTFMKIAQADVGKMVEPAKVAELVKKALVAKKPKKIYSINKNTKISLLTIFPKKWRDLLIRSAVKNKIK